MLSSRSRVSAKLSPLGKSRAVEAARRITSNIEQRLLSTLFTPSASPDLTQIKMLPKKFPTPVGKRSNACARARARSGEERLTFYYSQAHVAFRRCR